MGGRGGLNHSIGGRRAPPLSLTYQRNQYDQRLEHFHSHPPFQHPPYLFLSHSPPAPAPLLPIPLFTLYINPLLPDVWPNFVINRDATSSEVSCTSHVPTISPSRQPPPTMSDSLHSHSSKLFISKLYFTSYLHLLIFLTFFTLPFPQIFFSHKSSIPTLLLTPKHTTTRTNIIIITHLSPYPRYKLWIDCQRTTVYQIHYRH